MNLPPIGFGTSPFRAGRSPIDVEEPVQVALRAGYRMFDTAEAYGNERTVGRALQTVARAELTIIGKVWPTNYAPQHLRAACEGSLQRLGIDRFDLYLLHAPGALRHVAPLDDAQAIGWDELVRRGTSVPTDVPLAETWAAMHALVTAGLAAHIGVSNFTPDQMTGIDPEANEIACATIDDATLAWHQARDIAVLGYSPIGCATLRSLIDRGIRPITFSTNPEHIRENLLAV